ncbi:FUSC family protein [Streptomyces tubercidicus]|uniref:FUSC family protein n=1 Tax=Streptomyces tubercidicus TaxID=47759 RepID=UPI0037AB71AD
MSPQQGASPGSGPRRSADGPVGAGLRRLRYLLEHGRHGLQEHRTVVGNALQVTTASCAAFYFCRYGLGLTVMSVYATFTVVSLGALARIPGSGRQRATTVLTAIPAGLALITLGTLLAVQTWAAVVGMLVIGFMVAYAGTTGPRIAGAAPGMQLLYILPCFPPYAPDTLGQRLSGFLLGALLLALVQRFLLPVPDTPSFRRLLADAADAAARLADHRGGPPPVQALAEARAAGEALRPTCVPSAVRPASPTLAHKAMAHAAEAVRTLLAQLDALHTEAGPEQRFHPETVALLEGISTAARGAAVALRQRRKRLRPGEGPSATALQEELTPVRAHRAVDTLQRLSTDDRLVYLRRRTQVVQAADCAVVLVLATRLMLGDRTVERNPAGHTFAYARAGPLGLWWRRLTMHLTPRSVIFQNACRFALGLAAARAVAGLLGLQHGFWVLLATLTLTRTTSLETRSAVRQALTGTLVGAVLAGGMLALVHDRNTVYAVVLPVVMLVAFTAGPLRGLAWAQGGFTLVVATLFAQVSPVTWQLAPVRLVDVLVGSVIGLGCGLVAWPRGAGSELRRSMAGLCAAIADAIGHTTAQVVERSGGTDLFALNRALGLAQESLAQYQSEPREDGVQPDWPTLLVAGRDARRGERLLPDRPGRIASPEVGAWLRQAADRTAADYLSLAQHLGTDRGTPRDAPQPLDIRALLAVAPGIPRHSPERETGAVSAALLLDSVIWLDALTSDLTRLHKEM